MIRSVPLASATPLSGTDLWLVIGVAGAATFLIRLSFFLVFERVGTVGPNVKRVLSFVPAAVLAALVVPSFLSPGDVSTARLLAGTLAAVVAWRTESILGTIVTGLGALLVLRVFV